MTGSTTGRLLELEETLAQDARLDAADRQLLSVGEDRDMRAARHDRDLPDLIDVGQRAATEANELPGIEHPLEVFQAIRDGVPLVARRRDVEQLAVRDDRRNLLDGNNDDFFAMANGNPFEERRPRRRFVRVHRLSDA